MVKKILQERGKTHGDFECVSITSQEIKDAIHTGNNYHQIHSMAKESLDMIACKIARIVNGDFIYKDHWVDIVGYAQLIVDEIEEAEANNK